jgi:flagellar hook-associated protein 3 FlgL
MLQRQEQLATQKRINRPSDDPSGAARVLNGRAALSAIDQFSTNIKRGVSRLEYNEEVLGMVDELVQRARRIGEEKAGSEITAEERQLAASEVKEIYDQVLQLANSRFDGQYVFSGYQTATAPFSRNDDYEVTYAGDDGSARIPIAENVTVSIDADGRNYFHAEAGGGVNIFDELKDLIDGLEDSDLDAGSAAIQATIDPLENAHVQIMAKRTEGAPKLYRLQATQAYWDNFKPRIQEVIGREEDADITQAAVELQNLQVAYESTMAAAGRIIQPGLVDFLK